MVEFNDIFGRPINIGDFILMPAYFRGNRLAILFTRVLDIGEDKKSKYIKYSLDFDGYKGNNVIIAHTVKMKSKERKAFSAIKIQESDCIYEYNDNSYLYDCYSSNQLNDIGKRGLNIGDFVLLFSKSNFKKTLYGIVTSKDTVFTASGYLSDKVCFKLEHMTSEEENIYKSLVTKMQMNMLKVKENIAIGDIFMDTNRDIRYIYIGQFYKYIKEKNFTFVNTYENLTDKSYIYLKFNIKNKNDYRCFKSFNNSSGSNYYVTHLIESYLRDSLYNKDSHSISHLVAFKNPKKFNNYIGNCQLDLSDISDMSLRIYMKKLNINVDLKLLHELPDSSKLDNL